VNDFGSPSGNIKQSTSSSWVGSAQHHLSQIGKGVLVGGLTLGGYGLWKRWWWGTTEAGVAQENAEPSVSSGSESVVETTQPGITKYSLSAVAPEPMTNIDVAPQPSFSLEHSSLVSAPSSLSVEPTTSLAKELGIRYWEGDKSKQKTEEATNQLKLFSQQKRPNHHKPPYHTLSAPTPTQSIPEQRMEVGKLNSLTLRGADFFNGDIWQVGVTRENNSSLPVWGNGGLSGGPSYLGSYDTPGAALGVTVLNDLAYVADYESGLQIINVSNPTSPVLLGSYDTPGFAYGVYVLGNTAYVVDGDSLQILNVTNSASPSLLGSYDTPSLALGVTVLGNTAYVADYESGLGNRNIREDKKCNNEIQIPLRGIKSTKSLSGYLDAHGEF